MKYGTFGFRANPANKIINNKKLPKGNDAFNGKVYKKTDESL